MDLRDRIRQVHDVSVEMLGTHDLATVYQRVVDAACALESADAAALFVLDEKEESLRIVANCRLSDRYAARQRIPLERALDRYVFPRADDIRDLRTAALGDRGLIRDEGLATVLGAAIWRDGHLLGALHVYTRDPDREFDELDRELAHILAAQAGVAITNARLFDELRRVEEEREQFLSIVSHELRTPLTPLKALAQLQLSRIRRARERGQELDLDLLAKNLESIERQVDRMNGLVTDLLSVSRGRRGKLELDRRPMDLSTTVRDVVGRYVVATREEGRHRFTVDSPESLVISADEARVEQLLMNLVGNAVKYSPQGGEVTVTLRANDGAAEIAIRDQGIGIPKEDLGRLGEAFTRGAGRAATFAGMGIGFHVAKIVADGHGGSVQLESEGEDRGTTARVRLPL